MVATQLLLRVLYMGGARRGDTHYVAERFAQAPGALAGQVLFNICTGCLLGATFTFWITPALATLASQALPKGFVQARRAWDGFAGRYISCSRRQGHIGQCRR